MLKYHYENIYRFWPECQFHFLVSLLTTIIKLIKLHVYHSIFLILFSIQSWQYLCCYKKNLLLNKKKRIFPSYPILKLHWFVQNAVHVIPRVYDSYTCTFNEIGFSVFVLAYSNMASLFFWSAAFAPLSKLFCLKSDITLL